jgi:signal transduction histidine kinase
MRLAIDSLSPNEPDLLPVLGNFRFRMEARFHALGLRLHWRNHDMPDSLGISPHAGLQVLRILQEALTNVLKHAKAANVEVDLMFSEKRLRIRIRDDGSGIQPKAEKTAGYGVGNMQMRAQKIGAALTVESVGSGTTVALDLPLAALQAAIACE